MAAAPVTARSSAKRPPSPTSAEFALAGPSHLPDPRRYAFRKDLADIALTGQVIASHYAEPADRRLAQPSPLRTAPSEDSEVECELAAGAPFAMLDDSLGWAWGYAGDDRRVGYVRSEVLAA